MKKKKMHRIDVQGFIKNKLRELIQRDLRGNRIVSEADLQCEVHRHLKRYLNRDKRWKIFNKPHISKTLGNKRIINVFPDFLLVVREPRIAIELKEKKAFNEKRVFHDAEKLHQLKNYKKICRGFVFYLYRERKETESQNQKQADEATHEFSPAVTSIIINAYEHVPKKKWSKWTQMWDKHAHYRIK